MLPDDRLTLLYSITISGNEGGGAVEHDEEDDGDADEDDDDADDADDFSLGKFLVSSGQNPPTLLWGVVSISQTMITK